MFLPETTNNLPAASRYESSQIRQKMKSQRIAVIMAGGAGERFWPLSRQSRPKQLLRFGGRPPMLEETIRLISPIVAPQRIFIVTCEKLRKPIERAFPNFPRENIICEPEGKNTAPCLALATAVVSKKFRNPTIGVFTADHLINRKGGFRANVRAAYDFAEKHPALLTIGLRPTRPETGFGYIEAGELAASKRGGKIFRVRRFREKPDQHTARRFLRSNRFYWNSGMFFWQAQTLLRAFERFAPKFSRGVAEMSRALGTPRQRRVVSDVFRSFPTISIDYAVMEKADNAYMVEAEFDWEDIGTWTALHKIFAKNGDRNVQVGLCELHQCKNSIFYNAATEDSHLIAAYGVSDLIVVSAGDAVLVCHREHAQDVKKIVDELKKKKANKFIK
jgi:mannose-1-phosphate guanylyltransferase